MYVKPICVGATGSSSSNSNDKKKLAIQIDGFPADIMNGSTIMQTHVYHSTLTLTSTRTTNQRPYSLQYETQIVIVIQYDFVVNKLNYYTCELYSIQWKIDSFFFLSLLHTLCSLLRSVPHPLNSLIVMMMMMDFFCSIQLRTQFLFFSIFFYIFNSRNIWKVGEYFFEFESPRKEHTYSKAGIRFQIRPLCYVCIHRWIAMVHLISF